MLPHKAGFGFPIGFPVSTDFGFGDVFSPESVFGAGSGFKFGFRFWVPRHSTRPKPALLPSLCAKDARPCEGSILILLPHGISHLFSRHWRKTSISNSSANLSAQSLSVAHLLSSNRQAKRLHLLRSSISEQSKQAACISPACFNFSHGEALNPRGLRLCWLEDFLESSQHS